MSFCCVPAHTRCAVAGFPTRAAANDFELARPQSVLGGLFFQFDASGNVGFVIQTNSTVPAPS